MINILLALLQVSQHQTDIPLRRPRRLQLPGQRVLLPWTDEHCGLGETLPMGHAACWVRGWEFDLRLGYSCLLMWVVGSVVWIFWFDRSVEKNIMSVSVTATVHHVCVTMVAAAKTMMAWTVDSDRINRCDRSTCAQTDPSIKFRLD